MCNLWYTRGTMSCFVTNLDPTQIEKLQSHLTAEGFSFSEPKYTLFQAKKIGLSITLYESGKLTVQGKEKDHFIRYYLEPEILENLSYSYPHLDIDMTPRIGSDEAGKGDLFGPLCAASVYAGEKEIQKLLDLGVKDSKRMQDSTIQKLASEIKRTFSYEIFAIYPKRYNEIYEKLQNLNHLLAWAHTNAIAKLVKKTNCHNVLIDQFAYPHVMERQIAKAGLNLNLTQRTKGESDVVVAAASILARDAFLRGLEELSKEYKINLPKGINAEVKKQARLFLETHTKEKLPFVAKMHFKTVDSLV